MNMLLPIPKHLELYTSDQSKEIDQKTTGEFGMDGFTLMEIAACGASVRIENLQGKHKTGLFLCGKGNNAGDALAVARYLASNAKHKTVVLFLLGSDNLSPDTQKNLSLLRQMQKKGVDVFFIDSFKKNRLSSYDYIVDGIFGTGLSGPLKEPVPEVIECIHSSGLSVYAMDIPSGLDANSGRVHNCAVKANCTFTFGTNKLGFYLNRAKKYTGDVYYTDLPFPGWLRKKEAALINEDLRPSIPSLKRNARHKYEDGVVHIMAGSEGLTGAAMMAAKAAWNYGAGAVILYVPCKLLPIYEAALPQIIKVGVGHNSDTSFKSEHAEAIIAQMHSKQGVLLAGPGIGTSPESGKCLRQVLEAHHNIAILDADALSFWAGLKKFPAHQKKRWIVTPHPGEAKKYLKADFNHDYDRYLWGKNFAAKHGCSLVSKGNPVIVGFADHEVWLTGYDTSPFSRAGFGDVLAGTIAARSGITNNEKISIIDSLLTGYETFTKRDPAKQFGPEHLL